MMSGLRRLLSRFVLFGCDGVDRPDCSWFAMFLLCIVCVLETTGVVSALLMSFPYCMNGTKEELVLWQFMCV